MCIEMARENTFAINGAHQKIKSRTKTYLFNCIQNNTHFDFCKSYPAVNGTATLLISPFHNIDRELLLTRKIEKKR